MSKNAPSLRRLRDPLTRLARRRPPRPAFDEPIECGARGCRRRTSDGKPYCLRHVMLNPYASTLDIEAFHREERMEFAELALTDLAWLASHNGVVEFSEEQCRVTALRPVSLDPIVRCEPVVAGQELAAFTEAVACVRDVIV